MKLTDFRTKTVAGINLQLRGREALRQLQRQSHLTPDMVTAFLQEVKAERQAYQGGRTFPGAS